LRRRVSNVSNSATAKNTDHILDAPIVSNEGLALEEKRFKKFWSDIRLKANNKTNENNLSTKRFNVYHNEAIVDQYKIKNV
jgi:hypothetical protein